MKQPRYLIGDTETTGLPSSRKKAREDGQARVCQAAYILTDHRGDVITEIAFLIKPDGWQISAGAQAVHGFTNAQCEQSGISSDTAIRIFLELASQATHFVAHNNKFDWQMLSIEAEAHGLAMPKIERICTMTEPGRPVGHRSLAASLLHFCGQVIGDDAHDARADTKGCKDVLFAWKGVAPKTNGKQGVIIGVDEAELYADLV